MRTMASQLTGVSIVCSTVGSGADQRKHQSSASLAFVRGIHRWPVNSPHKRPVVRKMFPFDEAIMKKDRAEWLFVWDKYGILPTDTNGLRNKLSIGDTSVRNISQFTNFKQCHIWPQNIQCNPSIRNPKVSTIAHLPVSIESNYTAMIINYEILYWIPNCMWHMLSSTQTIPIYHKACCVRCRWTRVLQLHRGTLTLQYIIISSNGSCRKGAFFFQKLPIEYQVHIWHAATTQIG